MREALIQSVFAFILEIVCDAGNPMMKQFIQFLMKVNPMNESVLS